MGQNNPQQCPYGLYAEQLSGTAFTAPRGKNQRTWFYRIRPSVLHGPFKPLNDRKYSRICSDWSGAIVDPTQMRWGPEPLLAPSDERDKGGATSSSSTFSPVPPTTFLAGLATMAGTGDPCSKQGLAIHMYNCNVSMIDEAFSCADGDMLVVPETGALTLRTECGVLNVAPCEIAVVPRGVKFSVAVDGPSRGYVLELYQGHFELPGLGPIGANGLANPRDFLYPSAAFEDIEYADPAQPFTVLHKFGGEMFSATMDHSPFDVVAWHGNYAPFKYDLRHFCCINSVTFDHPDPSIYTVLTAPSDTAGVAIADFVIFPPRWMVMEHTFRPPWYHRNCMTEFMGMVYGKYDAKEGFMPGGASLHSCMSAHGPDAPTFEKASTAPLKPTKFDAGLAFMFETSAVLKLTKYAIEAPHRDLAYPTCWKACKKKFNGKI